MQTDGFITSAHYRKVILPTLVMSPNGWLSFIACNEGLGLAQAVKMEYDALAKAKGEHIEVPLHNDFPAWKRQYDQLKQTGTHDHFLIERTADTETIPRLPNHVGGSNVFLFQSVHEHVSGNSANDNFAQLLQMAWTLRAQRVERITAVIPYHPYSRQDKPTHMMRE